MSGTWDEIALLEASFPFRLGNCTAPLNIPGGAGIFCDVLTEDETHLLIKTFLEEFGIGVKALLCKGIL